MLDVFASVLNLLLTPQKGDTFLVIRSFIHLLILISFYWESFKKYNELSKLLIWA